MFTIFTILKVMGEGSRVVTARNTRAAAVAHAHALARVTADNLREADEQQYKVPVAADIYEVRLDAAGLYSLISVVHRPTGQLAVGTRRLVQELAVTDGDAPRRRMPMSRERAGCRP